MASDIFETVKRAAKDAGNKVSPPKSEGPGIGTELAEKVKMRRAADSALESPKGPAPRDESGTGVGGTASPYGSRKGEKRIDTSGMHSDAIKTYDTGGKVNVNDGKHELAILKHGERVLTEKQDKEYQKKMGKQDPDKDGDMDCYDEGGKVHTPEEKEHFSRSMHKLNAGGLHRHLGIAEDKPIPHSKKVEASHSDNPHVAAMGRMAVAMAGWKHPKKK